MKGWHGIIVGALLLYGVQWGTGMLVPRKRGASAG
jgi:hypothetical protein